MFQRKYIVLRNALFETMKKFLSQAIKDNGEVKLSNINGESFHILVYFPENRGDNSRPIC